MFCWVERIIVLWAFVVLGLLSLAGAFAPNVPAAANFWQAFTVFIAPPWIFLRLVDLVTGGPLRRRDSPLLRR